MRVAVVGAGWAGLAAAVRAVQKGHEVTLLEMASEPGGRARSHVHEGLSYDNGQHILIGAYARTLDLMQTVGVNLSDALLRMPLTLRFADGRGLGLREGPALPALLSGIARASGLGWGDRLGLVRAASAWALHGFRCDEGLTVDRLCRGLSPVVRRMLIDPLCVAALNTPAHEASGQVFLRVLKDALLGGRGSADLLLPRLPLSQLLPTPALHWLAAHGASVHLGRRVEQLQVSTQGWMLDGMRFDGVVLACSAGEAARLLAGHTGAISAKHAAWIRAARDMPFEPIITVYVQAAGTRLPTPMLALQEDAQSPAQFVFDHGLISGSAASDGVLACVISGARPWVDRGLAAAAQATLAQLHRELAAFLGSPPLRLLHTVAEKRATFRCVPGLLRPTAELAPCLVAAGDHVQGPYPATLEGAVRSGEAAVEALTEAMSGAGHA